MINFKDRLFYRCYDCGYGEKGVHDYDMSYEDVIRFFQFKGSHHISVWDAERFEKEKSTYFEFGHGTNFIVADCEFDEDDWETGDPLDI